MTETCKIEFSYPTFVLRQERRALENFPGNQTLALFHKFDRLYNNCVATT